MKKNQHITAFYLETLLLIVVFIAIILVLTNVFGLGRMQSATARRLTDAVCLAQNTAEAVAASDSPEALLALLDETGSAAAAEDTAAVIARYDESLQPAPDGAYRVDVTWLPESGERGSLVRSVIQVRWQQEETPLYSLETAAYKREVSA